MLDDQRRRILRRQLERFTENTIVDPAALRDHIQTIRREGYGYTVEELEVGLNAVVGAASVSGPVYRLPVESIPKTTEVVRKAAAEISRCLGYRG